MRRFMHIVFSGFLIALLTLAPAVGAQSDRPVIIAIGPEQPDTLVSDFASLAVTGYALSSIYSKLVKYDLDGNFAPDLAESWSVADDQVTWTFALRRDVVWHDGTPFTADDVIFTFEFRNSPEYTGADANELLAGAAAFKAGETDTLTGLRKIDDYTVSIQTVEPVATFLDTLAGEYILPRHIWSEIPYSQAATSPYATSTPIGTGPYRVASWSPDESLIFEANEDYFGGAPEIKTYIWRIIPEPTSQLSELITGGVDLVGNIPADSAVALEGEEGIRLKTITGVTQWYLTPNTRRAPFDNLLVRQALAHAIDLETLLLATNDGLGVITGGLVYPDLPERSPELTRPAYDPDLARALLAEAGYEDRNGDGIIEAMGVPGVEDGTPFTLELLAIADSVNTVRAQVLGEFFAAIGIDVTINTMDANLLFSTFYQPGGDFDAVVSGWSNLIVTPAEDLFYNYSSQGFFAAHGLIIPEIDEIIAQIPLTFDDEARSQLHWQIEALVAEQLPNIYLDRPDDFIGYDASLVLPDGINSPAELFSSVYLWSWMD